LEKHEVEMTKVNSELNINELEAVTGGARGEVVIVGCTTPRPSGGYPPGTIAWNPWIGQPYPQPKCMVR
jgi:bacteriocin-like protein